MTGTDFINCIAFCISLLIFVSAFVKKSLLRYIVCFFSLGIVQTMFQNSRLLLIVNLMICTCCFSIKIKNAENAEVLEIFSCCLTAVSLHFLYIAFFSSILILLSPVSYQSTTYNIVMGMGIVLLVFVRKYFYRLFPPQPFMKGNAYARYSIAVHALVLLFQAFVIPHYLAENTKNFAILTLYFLVFLAVVKFLLLEVNKLTLKNQKLMMESRHENDLKKQLDTAAYIYHTFFGIYKLLEEYIQNKDMSGLTAFFYKQIAPVQRSILYTQDIGHIHNELIHKQMENVLSRAHLLSQVIVHIDIPFPIDIPQRYVLNLYALINEWSNNALHSLQNQEQGILYFAFYQDGTELRFEISNSIENPTLAFYSIIQNTQGDVRSHGLELTKKIINGMENTEHFNFLNKFSAFDCPLFVQKIIINREKGFRNYDQAV